MCRRCAGPYYYQLRQLRPVIRSITEDIDKIVAQVFVSGAECCCQTDHENWKKEAYYTSSQGAALVTSSTAHRLQASCSCVAGPCLWNSLPVTLRDRDISLLQFKKLLKTLLFV